MCKFRFQFLLVHCIDPSSIEDSCACLIYKQNWLHFLFVIKATALEQQISKFYPQILGIEASYHMYTSQWPLNQYFVR